MSSRTPKSPAIGIDLGTTYSCVGVYWDGKIHILPNENGNRITPSCVGFTAEGPLVGERAQNETAIPPENYIYDIKRLIGKRFDDPTVTSDSDMWAFKVLKSDDGTNPVIKPSNNASSKVYFPQEISAHVLTKLKVLAEQSTGCMIRNAVITVPAYFNDSQRKSTKEAAEIAGLRVLRLVNEPTAAAMAYELDNEVAKEANVLVYDLGGGTFDVSILNIDEGVIEVKGVAGDTHLGGQDLLTAMVKQLANEFKNGQEETSCSLDQEAMRRLRDRAEWAKVRLSTEESVTVDIVSLMPGCNLDVTYTRNDLEKLSEPLLKKTITLVDKALDDAKMKAADITEIILVGGVTKMPQVRKMLQDHFAGNTFCTSINPDEAVAYGAAILAAKLNGDMVDASLLVDVTPLSLGIAAEVNGEDNTMSVLIHRNSSIPCNHKEKYITAGDNQTMAAIKVYEGERRLCENNRFLGECTLKNLPPAPAGQEDIVVTFDIDTDGIIHVSAVHEKTGNSIAIDIKRDPNGLSEKQIRAMIKDAEKHYESEKLSARQRTGMASSMPSPRGFD